MKPTLYFVIGVTNSGKTSLVDAAAALPDVGLIEVGKVLRAKYPPEYFKGSGNPEHTAKEAWQIFEDGIAQACKDKKRAVFISGQPRDCGQLRATEEYLYAYDCWFYHLFATRSELERRARARDANNPAALELSLARLKSDPPSVLEIVSLIHSNWPNRIVSVDTSAPDFSYTEKAKSILI
jgi:hypothetical protein